MNSGGPSSRTREERVVGSLLGGEGIIRMPLVIRVALDFGSDSPLELMGEVLSAAGYREPEDLRAVFVIPERRLIARVDAKPAPVPADSIEVDTVLEAALILGLCTATLYDPGRPVLWTEASLTRRLELFEPEGYYA